MAMMTGVYFPAASSASDGFANEDDFLYEAPSLEMRPVATTRD
jgi:hypothetical protein